MGCWYETCGISGLPITPGDKAVLFLLGPGTASWRGGSGCSGFSNPVGLWSPLSPPFFGKYNDDRGTLDFSKTPPAHWKLTQARFNDFKLCWTEDEEKSPKPLSVVYEYGKFFEPIERGYVQGRGHLGHRNKDHMFQIGQMLMRRDVWDHLLSMKFETWYGETSRELCHESARELVRHVQKHRPKSEKELSLSWAFEIERHFDDKPSPFIYSIFHPGESGPSFSLYRVSLLHALVRKEVDAEQALAIFYEIADVAHVNQLMSHLRRAWGPQCGKGSQDINWKLHADVLGLFGKIAEREALGEEE